jgi:hypothetical protein
VVPSRVRTAFTAERQNVGRTGAVSTSRVLRGVTENFLGTYTSRYSDHKGYWLFGFLSGAAQLDIDLLGDRYRKSEEPAEDARMFAMDAFIDQLMKAGVPEARLFTARLFISSSATATERLAGGVLRKGRDMKFVVVVVTKGDARYEARSTKFVAPHDSAVEQRSRRVEAAGSRPPNRALQRTALARRR